MRRGADRQPEAVKIAKRQRCALFLKAIGAESGEKSIPE